MEPAFWHRKWQHNDIGFHLDQPNPLLLQHFGALSLSPGARIFLPLCGKTLDIDWLLQQGFQVVGCELSELAVQQLFAELGRTPQISETGALRCYRQGALRVFVGDLFELQAAQLGTVEALYDRAALVALPPEMRRRYAEHLWRITDSAPQLLITLNYDQSLAEGPPFSVDEEEIRRHYGEHYASLKQLESLELEGGVKGCPAQKQVWLLR